MEGLSSPDGPTDVNVLEKHVCSLAIVLHKVILLLENLGENAMKRGNS